MKKLIILILSILCMNLNADDVPFIYARDHAVLLSIEADYSDTSLTISWEKNRYATGYNIARRTNRDKKGFYPNLNETLLDTNTLEFKDTDIEPGVLYEYLVTAKTYGKFYRDKNNPDDTFNEHFEATGYICGGIDVEIDYKKGKVLIIVEDNIAEKLPEEILRLRDDLLNEGYGSEMKIFGRTDEFNPDSVKAVKEYILNQTAMTNDIVSSIILLGRIAVPYSGNIAPDGHTENHHGAWPADLYYGYLDEDYWTDKIIDNSSYAKGRHINVPGDGKFDQGIVAYTNNVSIAVGRIDFSNMSMFLNDSTDEIQLYKNYLDKDHKYRTGQVKTKFEGVVDGNFPILKYNDGFSASGWRNIAAICGKENVHDLDFLTSLREDAYLFAMGFGNGTFELCYGVAESHHFADYMLNGIFTTLHGSFFGDWDRENVLLRAPLASMPSILTVAWNGSPFWYFHHMAMGYPIGYSTILSQNNNSEYKNSFAERPSIEGVHGLGNVSTALMGDPTLTAYPASETPKPKNLNITSVTSIIFELDWEAPDNQNEYFYNVYKSYSKYGQYNKVNNDFITETNFTDIEVSLDVDIYYIVKTVQKKHTNSGTFWHESNAAFATAILNVDNFNDKILVEVNPVPTFDDINITYNIPNYSRVISEIYDITGNKIIDIYDNYISSGKYEISRNLSSIPSGVYFLKTQINDKIIMEKIIVQ